jgi:hypothetical protein
MTESQPHTRCSFQLLFLQAGFHAVTMLVLIAGVSLLVAACTTPYKHPQLRPADAGFAGIDDSFGRQTSEVDVLLIHGMGTHNEQWVRSMVNQLAPALGFSAPADLPPADPLKHGAMLYRYQLASSSRQLHISAVLWSPVTSPAKATLCYDVDQLTSLCTDRTKFSKDKRAWANDLVKSQIMDDRLSDVTFYLNVDGGRQARRGFTLPALRALCGRSQSPSKSPPSGCAIACRGVQRSQRHLLLSIAVSAIRS